MFYADQIAYITVSNQVVQPVTILRIANKMCLVRLERAGEMWVPESRLYARKKDAEKAVSHFRLARPKVLTYIDKIRR